MKNVYRTAGLALLLLTLLCTSVRAQTDVQVFPTDTLCVPYAAGGLIADLFADDSIVVDAETYLVRAQLDTECFAVDRRGSLSFTDFDSEACCGDYDFRVELYRRGSAGENQLVGIQRVFLTVKCPKPDCGLVDLDDLPPADVTQNPDQPAPPACFSACENSTATYLFVETPGNAYDWQTSNGTIDVTPGLPNQITVSWGPQAPTDFFVDIYDADGSLIETRNFCVELTATPEADFSFAPVACLDQPVYFTSTSTGPPATYDWDFGDGGTAYGVDAPNHTYTSPGTYTVTLYATSDSGQNADGGAGCCCTDSISYDIVIDPLPGPGIFWISTLCEGDTSRYWTDATGCGTVNWTLSGNGTPVGPLTGDTISVVWTSGPAGTITLSVTDCDLDYCPAPSVAVVPIISGSESISGPSEVCAGQSAVYRLPKWMTTDYDWSVSGGAAVQGEGPEVTITWPTAPGEYTIDISYGSDFLAGLPGHAGNDCTGTAELTVTVLGDFTLAGAPNPVCVDDATFFTATNNVGLPSVYDWSVVGYPALDAPAQSGYSVVWTSLPGPGLYVIQAEVTDPENYCTTVQQISVVVTAAVDPVISGPADYCVGDSVVFSVASPAPGYTYNWTIDPGEGAVVAGNGGPTVTAVFTSGAGATVSVQGSQGAAPFCQSAVVSASLTTIVFNTPVAVVGPEACTNSLADYTIDLAQHPSAEYAWSVVPPAAGSVVAGADGMVATVQWNNLPAGSPPLSAAVVLDLTVCGLTGQIVLPLSLNLPTEPVISQVGDLCPGGSAQLYIDSLNFTDIAWDLGGNAGAVPVGVPGMITVFEAGDYVVHTVNLNGCPGVARFRVTEVAGPAVSISATSPRRACVNRSPFPAPVNFTASTDPANTVEWFCGGDSQGAAAVGNTTFTHNWTTEPGGFSYRARVTDPNGCFTLSDPIVVIQEFCCDTPFVVEEPLAQLHTFDLMQQTPNCDVVDLFATWSADSADTHGFTWFFDGASTLSSNHDPVVASDSRTVRLPGVGSYTLYHTIGVWAYDRDTTFVLDPTGNLVIDTIVVDSVICGDRLSQKVSVPVRAGFDAEELCGAVSFTDETQFVGGAAPAGTSWNWQFGDVAGSTSSAPSPVFDYGANGEYLVVLTVTVGPCISVDSMRIIVDDLPEMDFTVAPNPVCYGQPVTFTGTGSEVISWNWDFDDGSTFVGNGPQHAFLPAAGTATYNVKLVVESRAGCRDSITRPITVFAAPLPDTIGASNGLIICDGESTTLSVNDIPGMSYLWSTGATTADITVDAAGTYAVTVTTADGCALAIDPVEVQLIPLPDAGWSGNPFICDFGATTLTANAGGGHTVTWANNTLVTSQTGASYTVSYSPLAVIQSITLTVTNDTYGCSASETFEVKTKPSPTPIAAITSGAPCEGSGTTLSVINPQAGVVYTWNTGATGTSLFTYAAGTYTVIATDVESGCSGTDAVTVFPLPDLCVVPSGCYETCGPDTLSGPVPLPGAVYSYDWKLDGVTVGTDIDLVVTTNGSYTLTVTNTTTGCEATSDELILEVIDCSPVEPTDCDQVVTRLRSTQSTDGTGCCFELVYADLPADVYLIRISSPDADLPFVPGSVDPAFGFVANASPGVLQLAVSNPLTTPVPGSLTSGAVTFCPTNYTAVPQNILVEYLAADGVTVLCEALLATDCPVEPDCVFVATDTLTCDADGNLLFTLTICNPVGTAYPIGFIDFLPLTPAAEAVLTDGITLSPVLQPGDCQTITLTLPALPPGTDFAYSLIGHTADPATNPDALCCNDPTTVSKLVVPDCDPCDDLVVSGITQSGEGCCYDLTVTNTAAGFGVDGISLCLIGSDATLNMYSTIGDPLAATVGATGQTATVVNAAGGDLPLGNITLPTFCLESGEQPLHQIEIKYTNGDDVLCRDTITVFCTPPCGYLEEDVIKCEDNAYVWTGDIINTSDYTMSSAYLAFEPASGLSAYNQTITFGTPLTPGQATSITFPIGAPAGPGDTVCFRVILHETGPDELHLNCCAFGTCVVLPDCNIETCICPAQQEFRAEVNVGIDTLRLSQPGLAYRLTPSYQVRSCDDVLWEVRRLNPATAYQSVGTDIGQTYVFPEAGRYRVRLTVTRTDDSGKQCGVSTERTFRIGGGSGLSPGNNQSTEARLTDADVSLYPNPARTTVQLWVPGSLLTADQLPLSLLDANGRRLRSFDPKVLVIGLGQSFTLNLDGLPSGLYLLRGAGWTRKLVIR